MTPGSGVTPGKRSVFAAEGLVASHSAYTATVPNSPWAKFNTPLDLYTSTSPSATRPSAAPVTRPMTSA